MLDHTTYTIALGNGADIIYMISCRILIKSYGLGGAIVLASKLAVCSLVTLIEFALDQILLSAFRSARLTTSAEAFPLRGGSISCVSNATHLYCVMNKVFQTCAANSAHGLVNKYVQSLFVERHYSGSPDHTNNSRFFRSRGLGNVQVIILQLLLGVLP